MNIGAWVREVRRLLGVLHPDRSYHAHTSPIELCFCPERRVRTDKERTFPEHWEAKCGSCTCQASTGEEAAAALISRLEGEVTAKIAAARAELERLERAQAVHLRLVPATEKPS
jgi:hypothetical protein